MKIRILICFLLAVIFTALETAGMVKNANGINSNYEIVTSTPKNTKSKIGALDSVTEILRLKLYIDQYNYDDIVIAFNAAASPAYNYNEDSKYLPGINAAEGLASYSSDGVPLSINFLPLPKTNTETIRLDVQAKNSGPVTLKRTQLDQLPSNYSIWLVDNYLKDSVNLRVDSNYAFAINNADTASFGSYRFKVVISESPAVVPPLQLVDFNAVKATTGAEISWKTQNEGTSTHFDVERSSDGGKTYSIIDSLVSTAVGSYSFTDVNPPADSDAYRLKIIDNSGKITYSNVITLAYGTSANTNATEILRLKLYIDQYNYDDIVIAFNAAASPAYNYNEDSKYLAGINAAEGLASYSSDGVPLSINFLPLPKTNTETIRLDVEAKNSGPITLKRTQLDQLPANYSIWLVDNYLKDSVNLRVDSNYAFNINKADTASFGSYRFKVVISGSPPVVPPLQLEDFNAVKAATGAEITWKTQNESIVTHFDVERSSDGGKTYSTIDSLVSTAVGSYSFTDVNPPADSDAYRLKIIDDNRKITYSNVITLAYGTSANTNATEILRLKLYIDQYNYDDIVIAFNAAASSAYNYNEDSKYLAGINAAEGLASYSSDGVPLSINFLPLPKTNTETIRLDVQAKNSGPITLKRTELDQLPSNYSIWLVDNYLKDSVNLRVDSNYAFNINKADTASLGSYRFKVVISESPAVVPPLQLVDFNAVKATTGAEISWKTQNEGTSTHFDVERSSDGGKTYSIIDSLVSTAVGCYSFTDVNPPVASDDYRVKVTDRSGVITYTNVITLIYGSAANIIAGDISIYPNPSNSMINLSINQGGNSSINSATIQSTGLSTSNASGTSVLNVSYNIKIMSISGLVIRSATSSNAVWQDNVASLSPGTYIIAVINNLNSKLVGRSTFIKL